MVDRDPTKEGQQPPDDVMAENEAKIASNQAVADVTTGTEAEDADAQAAREEEQEAERRRIAKLADKNERFVEGSGDDRRLVDATGKAHKVPAPPAS